MRICRDPSKLRFGPHRALYLPFPDNLVSPRRILMRLPAILLFACVTISLQAQAQSNLPLAVGDYPMDRAGVFIKTSDWSPVASEMPTKTKVAHGLAASLSYGLAPAKVVAEYVGEHAPTQVASAQPVLCICHIISIPGEPVIVRLHPKKGSRELNGGRMIVYPVVGGSKMADADKTDLIPADVSHPDPQVWIVRPQFALTPGEYALMLGTQNISIFPFSVGP
jgi:hypothetical protein